MKTNNQIKGDLSVCCSATVAGQFTAGSSATVKGNLRVEGWLDAKNLRTPCKGLFADEEESLMRAYPAPMPGWWALIGETLPAAVWRAECGDRRGQCKWTDTGEPGGEIVVDLDAYDSAIEEVNSRVNDLAVEIENGDHPVEVADTSSADLIIADEAMNPIVTFANGHIRTACFDSSSIMASGSADAAAGGSGKLTLPGKWCSLGTSITAWDKHRTNDIRGYQYWVRKRVDFAGGYVNNGVDAYRMYSLADNLSLIVPADYYTLEFGTNDFLGGISVGTMDDYINSTGTATFLGAMRIVIDKIYDVNPAALIMLCTPRKCYYAEFGVQKWDAGNANGVKITAFVEAVRDVAQYESLPVADFFALTNTNRHNLPAHSDDVALHPNTLGHQMMANVMVEQFRLFHRY